MKAQCNCSCQCRRNPGKTGECPKCGHRLLTGGVWKGHCPKCFYKQSEPPNPRGEAECDGKKFPYNGKPHLTPEMIAYAEEKLTAPDLFSRMEERIDKRFRDFENDMDDQFQPEFCENCNKWFPNRLARKQHTCHEDNSGYHSARDHDVEEREFRRELLDLIEYFANDLALGKDAHPKRIIEDLRKKYL